MSRFASHFAAGAKALLNFHGEDAVFRSDGTGDGRTIKAMTEDLGNAPAFGGRQQAAKLVKLVRNDATLGITPTQILLNRSTLTFTNPSGDTASYTIRERPIVHSAGMLRITLSA